MSIKREPCPIEWQRMCWRGMTAKQIAAQVNVEWRVVHRALLGCGAYRI